MQTHLSCQITLPNFFRLCSVLITPRAVPYPAVASEPVLQCVKILTRLSPGCWARIVLAPKSPIAWLSAMSFSIIASIADINLKECNYFITPINQYYYTRWLWQYLTKNELEYIPRLFLFNEHRAYNV